MTDEEQVLTFHCCEHCSEDCQEKFPPHRGPCIYKECSGGRAPLVEKRQKGNPEPEPEDDLTPALPAGIRVRFTHEGTVIKHTVGKQILYRTDSGAQRLTGLDPSTGIRVEVIGWPEPTEHGAKVKATTARNSVRRTVVRAYTSETFGGVWTDGGGANYSWDELIDPEVVA